ncbi:hypothetical protein T4B_11856 [Trichinella pseudospiralis]|uniref:Uncharacterized protein n=1 Tax=Trichinella pseudospiralis TaxID=6337 RepID=A0A0V1JVT5_TRIPS|nr:hypothetical protein T4A_13524 [Trichinella pseudospiralis]KRZ20260.1 hypothetical protein T4B_11856 [Trichinella pseudospiralis]KRZ39068.1 hypothetical protein T4C_3429 [Trichinella pseudospiralis]
MLIQSKCCEYEYYLMKHARETASLTSGQSVLCLLSVVLAIVQKVKACIFLKSAEPPPPPPPSPPLTHSLTEGRRLRSAV